jgi:hypothetical protein
LNEKIEQFISKTKIFWQSKNELIVNEFWVRIFKINNLLNERYCWLV